MAPTSMRRPWSPRSTRPAMTRWRHEPRGQAFSAPLRRDGRGDAAGYGRARVSGRLGHGSPRRELRRVHVPGDGDHDDRPDGRLDDLPRSRLARQRGDVGLDVRADLRRHRRPGVGAADRPRRADDHRARRDAAGDGGRDAAPPRGIHPPSRPRSRHGAGRAGDGMNVAGRLAGFAGVLALAFAGAAFAGSRLDVHPGKPQPKSGMGEMVAQAVRGLAVSDNGLTLALARNTAPEGKPFALAFRIVDRDGQTVRDFDVEHTRRMHFIVVRRDMTGFQHLHPTENPDGTWSLPVTLSEAGSYRVFADFSVGGKPYTLADDLTVDGSVHSQALPAPAKSFDVDGLRV